MAPEGAIQQGVLCAARLDMLLAASSAIIESMPAFVRIVICHYGSGVYIILADGVLKVLIANHPAHIVNMSWMTALDLRSVDELAHLHLRTCPK